MKIFRLRSLKIFRIEAVHKFLLLVFLCLFSCYASALENHNDIALMKGIQNVIDNYRIKYNFPAISLSIKLPDTNKIYNYVSGYYSLSTNNKITPETLFQIGSITKTFTATIIYKLIEENKLKEEDDLATWLPQYPRWKQITIDNLLHHTSGVYDYTSGKEFDNLLRENPYKYWSLNELADMAYKHTDLSAPGQKYNYTNTDYVLLGIIIEKVMHKSIQQVFNDYLKRYGLNNTFYAASGYPEMIKNRIAHGYNQDGTFKFNTDATFVSISFAQSAGSMISTPDDLVRWLNKLFTGKIIHSNSLKKMTTIISENDVKVININDIHIPKKFNNAKPFTDVGIGAGIGLINFKSNGMAFVHSGGTPGYESLFAYNPCNGIYLVLAYNVKPKDKLIFIKIADKIFSQLNKSSEVVKAIKAYQQNNLLPNYCKEE